MRLNGVLNGSQTCNETQSQKEMDPMTSRRESEIPNTTQRQLVKMTMVNSFDNNDDDETQ